MISKIEIKNYKAFGNEVNTLELRPITLLIGKNSSGKTSLCKLLPLLENATSGELDTPLLLKNNDITLGSRFEDLFHNGSTTDLEFKVYYEDGNIVGASYLMLDGKLMVYHYQAGGQGFPFFERKISERTTFNGLIHYNILRQLNLDPAQFKFKVDYLGPIRIESKRTIEFEGYGKIESVGLKGDNTYNILLNSYLQEDGLFSNVSKWMENNMEGQKLAFKMTAPGTYALMVVRDGAEVNVADVGFGLCQVLPVITQSFMPKGGDVEVIEQPVLHLHPAAHANVAYRLAESAKTTGRKYLIETHSENFLLGLRKLVSDPQSDFNVDDVIIYYVNHDGEAAYLEPITVDENGELSSWPTGVFSESFDLMAEIMNNKR